MLNKRLQESSVEVEEVIFHFGSGKVQSSFNFESRELRLYFAKT